MPYADLEKRREYHRDYQRRRRTGLTGSQTSNLDGPVRIKTAKDVLMLLEETINQVREAKVDALVRARCLGFLASISLKAVETADIEGRVKALEGTLRLRRETK